MAYLTDLNGRLISFYNPLVMGIVNFTPDSFYAPSRLYDSNNIGQKLKKMAEEGVDIFDFGGYSSRPGAEDIDAEEEFRRLAPGLEAARCLFPSIPISVDTFRADVAKKCFDLFKVEIINDISGGDFDPEMWPVIAETGVTYIIMHTRGTPKTMSALTDYKDVTAEVFSNLAFKIDRLHSLGVSDIIADPGFGFAKNTDQNFELLRNFREFKRLGVPLLAGLSRKSMIRNTIEVSPEEALNGTTVLNTLALREGADILRVHDVREAKETIKLFMAFRKPKPQ